MADSESDDREVRFDAGPTKIEANLSPRQKGSSSTGGAEVETDAVGPQRTRGKRYDLSALFAEEEEAVEEPDDSSSALTDEEVASPSPGPGPHASPMLGTASGDDSDDSDEWASGRRERRNPESRKSRVGSEGRPDEDAEDQPDVVATDLFLALPSDGPGLMQIIAKIEADRTLCFKMRWYVARHVRKLYTRKKPPSLQPYQRPIRNALQHYVPGKMGRLRSRPFNRLDFEATRLHEAFRKDQPDWESKRVTQALQLAYSTYQWNETIYISEVDEILIEAGADLSLFAKAEKASGFRKTPAAHIDAAIDVQEPNPAKPDSDYAPNIRKGRSSTGIAVVDNTRRKSTRLSAEGPNSRRLMTRAEFRPRDLAHDEHGPSSAVSPLQPNGNDNDTPGVTAGSSGTRALHGDRQPQEPLPDDINALWAEISDLKKEAETQRQFTQRVIARHRTEVEETIDRERRYWGTFITEHKASTEALLTELQAMREKAEGVKTVEGSKAAEGSKKRKRDDKDSTKKKKKMRKLMRRLKELDADSSSADDSSSSDA